MKKATKSTAIPLDDIRREMFQDPKRAKYALKLALETFTQDNDLDALLDTLNLVAQAQGGMTRLARQTTLSRQTLYEALSPRGNPRIRTFQTVLKSLGYRLAFKPVPRHAAAHG